MPAFVNLKGHRYGRWIVLSHTGYTKRGAAQWLCRCDCGAEQINRGNTLRTGASKSCGCLNTEVHRAMCIERNTTHGLSKTKTYHAWANMKSRCLDPFSTSWKKYGAKGIKVCKRWRDSFEHFHEDMGEQPSEKHTLERINSHGNYEPSNCKWATMKEQQNNRTNNHWIEAFSKRMTLQQWSESTGFPYKTILGRLELGWSPEEALTLKPRLGRNQHTS